MNLTKYIFINKVNVSSPNLLSKEIKRFDDSHYILKKIIANSDIPKTDDYHQIQLINSCFREKTSLINTNELKLKKLMNITAFAEDLKSSTEKLYDYQENNNVQVQLLKLRTQLDCLREKIHSEHKIKYQNEKK